MSEEAPPLQRILVALDASPHSEAALDAAIRLARVFETQIEGLFVENETLLRAAQLPFSKEVRSYTAPPKQLSDRRMERQLQYQAEYAEHTLQRMAEQADVPYDFRTARGDVTRELLRAAPKVDLLVLGKTSTTSSRRRLGSTSQTLLSEAPSPVLVLRKAIPARQPILLYFDGSDAAHAAMNFAVRLARRTETNPLQILTPPEDTDDATGFRNEIRSTYGPAGVPMQVHSLTPAEAHRLSAFAREKGGLVVLPADCPSLQRTPLQQFLYEIDRPLLVVR